MQPHQACHILPHIACWHMSPGTTSCVALPGNSLLFGIISDNVLYFSFKCHCVVQRKHKVYLNILNCKSSQEEKYMLLLGPSSPPETKS